MASPLAQLMFMFVLGMSGANRSNSLQVLGAAGDMFGNSVSISGDDILIGSFHDDTGSTNAGAAYVYTRTGSVWNQQTKLTAAVAANNDYFGTSVSIVGDIALVAAYDFTASETGSVIVYLFERLATNWNQVYYTYYIFYFRCSALWIINCGFRGFICRWCERLYCQWRGFKWCFLLSQWH